MAPISLGGAGIEPADAEHPEALADQVSNQAFIRRQVQYVELVDLRWDQEQWYFMCFFRKRSILDHFQHVVAENYGALSIDQVVANFEITAVYLRRQRIACDKIIIGVSESPQQGSATGFKQSFQCCRVSYQCVGG